MLDKKYCSGDFDAVMRVYTSSNTTAKQESFEFHILCAITTSFQKICVLEKIF